MQLFVTFQPPEEVTTLRTADQHEITILDTLSDPEEDLAIQLKELLQSVTEAVQSAITTAGELEIKVSGSLATKASGGATYLFFNVGAEAGKTNTMEVVFKTKIEPQEKHI